VREYPYHIKTSVNETFPYVSCKVKKGKRFPHSLPSVGPGADPGGRLPLLSAVTFPATEHAHPLAGTHFTISWRVEG